MAKFILKWTWRLFRPVTDLNPWKRLRIQLWFRFDSKPSKINLKKSRY
jgi:hypothetical protein